MSGSLAVWKLWTNHDNLFMELMIRRNGKSVDPDRETYAFDGLMANPKRIH
jgi:hypothetical protein